MSVTAVAPAAELSAPPAHPSRKRRGQAWPVTVQATEYLRISLSRTRGGAVVRLEGELDIAGAPALTGVLERCVEQGGSITVDAAALTFIDAAGIRPLADAQARCCRRGRGFRLVAAGVAVRRVVTLTGLADRLFGTG